MKNITEIFKDIKTPAYVLDEAKLIKNLETAKRLKTEANCKIVLALKGFSMFAIFPLIREYLDGTTASGFNEAMLGYETFGKEVHTYSPAYTEEDIEKLIPISNHLSFNTISQLEKFYQKIKSQNKNLHIGLRVNPLLSLVKNSEMYNPCSPCSRLGENIENINDALFEKISGLHFHILCENLAEDSIKMIDEIEAKFSQYFRKISWINFGGGHYINHPDYNLEKLISRVKNFKNKYPHIEVIFEPGGAIAYDAGWLVASVLDVVRNQKNILILDTSATAHMPDVIEMPYRPRVINSGLSNEKKYTYLMGGNTCLSGDIIGEYSFDKEVKAGDKIIFEDMMQYTMVKNTTFNGIALPDIAILRKNGDYEIVKSFNYQDFKMRLS
ncbi:MAG: carboxynorspermidine decarboxylase [Rickettsiales bacterium]|nr:carboxynorspermidine decarboxylase [Rickettsiales bacterium]